jgi:hypothetical protein
VDNRSGLLGVMSMAPVKPLAVRPVSLYFRQHRLGLR